MRMLRWLGGMENRNSSGVCDGVGVMTDDPLAAAIGPAGHLHQQKQIYSVSRSVVLPRVALRTNAGTGAGTGTGIGGINPIFVDSLDCTTLPHKPNQLKHPPVPPPPPPPAVQQTPSSGYGSHGGSSHDPIYTDNLKLREDAVAILEQNASFVKQILVAVKGSKSRKSVGSLGSSATGTLSTIPEGKVDFSIPRPVWPKLEETGGKNKKDKLYDSLIDESVLLYTSLSYRPDKAERLVSATEILKEITETINLSKQGEMGLSPEQILTTINEKLTQNLAVLQQSTEEDMRQLSVNLSNSEHINSVLRAFSANSVTSSAGEWTDIYQVPSSSSGFSDTKYEPASSVAVFVHDDLATVPNGVRNAMIYGTLCRGKAGKERLLGKQETKTKESLLAAPPDAKPSVWEIYYGQRHNDQKETVTDQTYFPAGRPEADFTLDVPRSELLSRRMKSAKKWRFRCRIVTSFLGLVFFLLSLMAVSLILTRGKRMFGSMV